jgi:16S rRNA processing protein RimM
MTSGKNDVAGLPSASKPAFLAVGRIRRPHGVRGQVLMEIYTDFPERLLTQRIVYVGRDHRELKLASVRSHNDGLLLGFEGIVTPEDAGLLRNQILYVDAREQPELPKGEYYHHQLIGMQVLDENDQNLGTLTEILETGANDVYVIKTVDGSELLLPAIPEVILEVDLPNKIMLVHILPGLLAE